MKVLAILGILLLPLSLTAQETTNSNSSFETFCLKEAISVMEVSPSKMDKVKIEGELDLEAFKANSTYKDYNIELSEDRTLYYKIKGTDALLVAQSLYRLRLRYQNQKK